MDIYSLGIVLYRLLNHNRLPFLNLEKQLITYRDKENALTRRMSGEEFPKPADGSNEFAHIIRRACAYRPEERYQHPEAFRKALEDLQSRCAAGNTEADPVQEHREADFATEDAGAKILTYKEDSQEKTKTGEILPGNWERLLESGAPGQRRHGAKHDRRSTVRWVAIIVAVGLFVCFGAGAYLKRMVEDTIRVQTEKMVSALESDKYGTAKDTEEDFATSIEVIKDRATAIVEEMDSYQLEGREEQRLRYYNKEGEIMKVLVYPSWSEDGVYEEYYYWNGALFFAYIWEGEKTELYYYRDGMLIRWIDENGVPHDNEFDNDEYNRRGDKYWSNSIEQLR